MYKILKTLIHLIAALIFFPVVIVTAIALRLRSQPSKPRLIWGPIPIISNKYWSLAMREANYHSKTLMYPHYSINQESDFDFYIHKIIKIPVITLYVGRIFGSYFTFIYAIWNFEIFHHPANGGFLGQTPLWRCEALLLHLARKKIIILPYGGDLYRYSKVIDPCLRHALLLSYPDAAKQEKKIEKKISYWTKNADIFIPFIQIDGIGRWDMLPVSMLTIDTKLWGGRKEYSPHNGATGSVHIVHTPNHRGFKGTEFLISIIEELRAEGLKINLILLEKIANADVKKIMETKADILTEQFIFTGYAMSGVEGMASGTPVLANLENETYTRLFRRYSYLNECPILSTTPENLKNNIRLLVTQPLLRESLGKAGRMYVEKYHSTEAAQHIFSSIYEKIYFKKEIDLMNFFHPLKSEFNKKRPPVDHPLKENRLPVDLLRQC